MEQLEDSPPRDPLAEDELVAVLANMREYYQPSSLADLPNESPEENAPEKSHAEEENLPVHDDEIGETNREQSVPTTPEEILVEAGADLRASHESSTETLEIKKLRREQQKFLNIIAQLRQQIRVLKANQRIRRSRRAKRPRTNSHPANQNPAESPAAVPNNAEEPTVVPSTREQQFFFVHVKQEWPAEEQTVVPSTEGQHQTFIHVKKEKENKEVQTEAPPSGVIRVLNSKQRNKKVQVKIKHSF